jgi:hypothetical protein
MTDASPALERDLKLAETMVCLNHAVPPVETTRRLTIGRTTITYRHRSPENLWGRFGGGWQMIVGMQWSTWRHVIITCFVFSLIISTPRPKVP